MEDVTYSSTATSTIQQHSEYYLMGRSNERPWKQIKFISKSRRGGDGAGASVFGQFLFWRHFFRVYIFYNTGANFKPTGSDKEFFLINTVTGRPLVVTQHYHHYSCAVYCNLLNAVRFLSSLTSLGEMRHSVKWFLKKK